MGQKRTAKEIRQKVSHPQTLSTKALQTGMVRGMKFYREARALTKWYNEKSQILVRLSFSCI